MGGGGRTECGFYTHVLLQKHPEFQSLLPTVARSSSKPSVIWVARGRSQTQLQTGAAPVEASDCCFFFWRSTRRSKASTSSQCGVSLKSWPRHTCGAEAGELCCRLARGMGSGGSDSHRRAPQRTGERAASGLARRGCARWPRGCPPAARSRAAACARAGCTRRTRRRPPHWRRAARGRPTARGPCAAGRAPRRQRGRAPRPRRQQQRLAACGRRSLL